MSRIEMTRVKAIYRSWAIPCSGQQVYAPRHRAEWLGKISEPGVRRRAEFYYPQLDALRTVRQEVRRELLAEGKKHQAWRRLCQIPSIGPIRSAVLLGNLQTPHRFRTKRQLWTYSGFGLILLVWIVSLIPPLRTTAFSRRTRLLTRQVELDLREGLHPSCQCHFPPAFHISLCPGNTLMVRLYGLTVPNCQTLHNSS